MQISEWQMEGSSAAGHHSYFKVLPCTNLPNMERAENARIPRVPPFVLKGRYFQLSERLAELQAVCTRGRTHGPQENGEGQSRAWNRVGVRANAHVPVVDMDMKEQGMNDVQVDMVMLKSERHEKTQETAAAELGEGVRRGVQDKLRSLQDW